MRLSSKYSAHPASTRRNFAHLELRRREGMKLLLEGHSQSDVARQLKVSEVSVSRWKRALIYRGGDAWRRGRLGKPPKLVAHHLEVIRELLRSGARTYGFPEDHWTFKRLATTLKTLTGVEVHPDHLCRVVHRHGLMSGPDGQEPVCDRSGMHAPLVAVRDTRLADGALC